VSSEEFPADVERFINEQVNSVAQLEILLLLRSDSARQWTTSDVAGALRTTPETAAEQLATLRNQELAAQQDDAGQVYRYAPSSEELRQLIDRLAAIYEERRVTVITMIYSKPVSKVRTFADAFRLRKEN
jgi:hypothetical protein